MPIPSARALGAFAMLTFFSSLLGAKPPAGYPHLSENLAASASLEARKVLHGDVEGLFAIPRTRQVVAVAGMMEFGTQPSAQTPASAPEHYWLRDPAMGPRIPEMGAQVKVPDIAGPMDGMQALLHSGDKQVPLAKAHLVYVG